MELQYDLKNDHLFVVARGDFHPGQAREGLSYMIGVCEAKAISRIFVDGRLITTPVSIADRFDIATQLAAMAPAALRMAILVDPANMLSKTLENTATNRGAQVRTTDSADEAWDYLGLNP
jgi:hypothetical protein